MSEIPNLDEQLVTDTVEYKGRKITFKLVNPEYGDSKARLLWFIEAVIDGFKKPFRSIYFNSIFQRDAYEKAKDLSSSQDFLDALYLDASFSHTTRCELLTATLDRISVMWYCNGEVQIEEDLTLIRLVKLTIDKFDEGDIMTMNALKVAGFI